MALAHRTIDDDFFRSLRSEFTDAQIVEAGVHALRMTEGDDRVTLHVTFP
jgi:hypothetical protein